MSAASYSQTVSQPAQESGLYVDYGASYENDPPVVASRQTYAPTPTKADMAFQNAMYGYGDNVVVAQSTADDALVQYAGSEMVAPFQSYAQPRPTMLPPPSPSSLRSPSIRLRASTTTPTPWPCSSPMGTPTTRTCTTTSTAPPLSFTTLRPVLERVYMRVCIQYPVPPLFYLFSLLFGGAVLLLAICPFLVSTTSPGIHYSYLMRSLFAGSSTLSFTTTTIDQSNALCRAAS
jgi:hypothetical protein